MLFWLENIVLAVFFLSLILNLVVLVLYYQLPFLRNIETQVIASPVEL